MSDIKVLHTSDWHLGKKLFKADRSEEQKMFLDWLYQEIVTKKIDVLVIAGDVYDVPNPPNSAQQMFYDFIYKLGQLGTVTTIVIAGNHDSTSLFKVPKSFFLNQNCYIYSGLTDENHLHELNLTIKGTNLGFKLLPYFRNYELINKLNENQGQKEDFTPTEVEAGQIESFFRNYFDNWNQGPDFKFLIAHHGFGQYSASGSEHAIYLSGLEYFPLSWVEDSFDYTALGHIHKRQTLKENPPIIYPGSPYPLRFSESNKKYYSLINLKQNKELSFNYIQVPEFRNLVQIKAPAQNILEAISSKISEYSKDDLLPFLEVMVELDKPESGLVDTIRASIKDKAILLSYIPVVKDSDIEKKDLHEIHNLNIGELFEEYYKKKFPGESLPKQIETSFKELLEEIRDENS